MLGLSLLGVTLVTWTILALLLAVIEWCFGAVAAPTNELLGNRRALVGLARLLLALLLLIIQTAPEPVLLPRSDEGEGERRCVSECKA